MTSDGGRMSCDGFAEQLADYLEEELDGTMRLEVESHAAACSACGELLADLRAIRERAAALPALEPSRDLWAGIAARIDAPVLPLEAGHRARVAATKRAWVRPSIAAAALILVTAGVTHVLTRAAYVPTADGITEPRVARAVDLPGPAAAGRGATDTGSASALAATGIRPVAAVRSVRTGGPSATPATLAASTVPTMQSTQPLYDREIAALRAIVRDRRSTLDSGTVAVLERSIAVIDTAIAQSRAALARDPASGFLATQLNQSLEKKVELLRTAASLPSRT